MIIGSGLLDDLAHSRRSAQGRHPHQPTLAQTAEVSGTLADKGSTRIASRSPTPRAGKDLPVLGFIWEVLGRIGIGRKDAIVSLGGERPPTSPVSPPRPGCAVSTSCTCPRRCSAWSTPRSAARPVSTPSGKNLVGAFHQPAAVIVDSRHWKRCRATSSSRNGRDREGGIHRRPRHSRPDRGRPGGGARPAEPCCRTDPARDRVKAEVVAADEKESQLREILN